MAEAKSSRGAWRQEVITTLGAFVLAFLLGAILMIVTDAKVRSTFGYFFGRPGDALNASWGKVSGAYSALFAGAFGGWMQISQTLAAAAPLILGGLGVALAFRAGLFNIGAQGQAIMGATLAAYVGFSWQLPPVLHALVAALGGLLGGAVWGGIAGWLKAKTGAHEVIVTIMLNLIALRLLGWLLTTGPFLLPDRGDSVAPPIAATATYARIPDSLLSVGFGVALLGVLATWWLLERSTLGFQIRAVGANPAAAATAGINVGQVALVAMALAGGLAGLAGAELALAPSVNGSANQLTNTLVGTIGFDAITVALLGRARPWGVLLAGLLFGALNAGGLAMQSLADTPRSLTTVLQALIVLFVAAPAIVATLVPFLKARTKPTALVPQASAGGVT